MSRGKLTYRLDFNEEPFREHTAMELTLDKQVLIPDLLEFTKAFMRKAFVIDQATLDYMILTELEEADLEVINGYKDFKDHVGDNPYDVHANDEFVDDDKFLDEFLVKLNNDRELLKTVTKSYLRTL